MDITDLQRQLANMIRVGVVSALDEANARVQLRVAGLTTDWLPWGTARAGATRTWSAPTIGEQVILFSPYGDMGQAIVGPSIYQDSKPAPAATKDRETTVYPDGSTVDYNSATNTLTVTVSSNGVVVLNCKQATINCETSTVNASESVTLNTPETLATGNVTVEGLLTYMNGIAGSGGTNGNAISGTINVTGGDVKADSISLKLHRTSGVDTGTGISNVPVP